ADLPSRLAAPELVGAAGGRRMVRTSAVSGEGLDDLKQAIGDAVLRQRLEPAESILITHLRHRTALVRAKESLEQVRLSLERHMPAECVALDLRAAVNAIREIIGETTIDDVLNRIFKEFCIGK